MANSDKYTKYSLTERARLGFETLGERLHITGLTNIISFTIWNLIDVEPCGPEEVNKLKESCIKRIGYVTTPKRTTTALTFADDTKELFERIYVTAGIDSFSAALDLLGSCLPIKYDSPVQYINGFANPFYVDQSRGFFIKVRGSSEKNRSSQDDTIYINFANSEQPSSAYEEHEIFNPFGVKVKKQ